MLNKTNRFSIKPFMVTFPLVSSSGGDSDRANALSRIALQAGMMGWENPFPRFKTNHAFGLSIRYDKELIEWTQKHTHVSTVPTPIIICPTINLRVTPRCVLRRLNGTQEPVFVSFPETGLKNYFRDMFMACELNGFQNPHDCHCVLGYYQTGTETEIKPLSYQVSDIPTPMFLDPIVGKNFTRMRFLLRRVSLQSRSAM